MSIHRQRPEHLVIREYIRELERSRAFSREDLVEAFVPVYQDMVPRDDDSPTEAPSFELGHRLDPVAVAKKKDQASFKKLWRAIDGDTFFPLVCKEPLIAALDTIKNGLGEELRKRLLHNLGLLHVPIDPSGKTPIVYSEWLKEMAEANLQMVADSSDDGLLNSEKTKKELLDVLEKTLQVMFEIERNQEVTDGGN